MAQNTARISLTLDAQTKDDIDYLSSRMGVTRSSLVSELLAEPAHDLRLLVESVPLNPTPEDVIRARGVSLELIRSRVENVKGLASDLFGGGE